MTHLIYSFYFPSCNNQPECQINISEVFNGVCERTMKYLKIEYVCEEVSTRSKRFATQHRIIKNLNSARGVRQKAGSFGKLRSIGGKRKAARGKVRDSMASRIGLSHPLTNTGNNVLGMLNPGSRPIGDRFAKIIHRIKLGLPAG